jgi:hypothetical protein
VTFAFKNLDCHELHSASPVTSLYSLLIYIAAKNLVLDLILALANQVRQRRVAEFCSIPNAGVRQAPAKWMRQRQGANFCSLFNAGVPQALAKWMRQRQGAPLSTPAFLKRQRNGCTSVRVLNFAHRRRQRLAPQSDFV